MNREEAAAQGRAFNIATRNQLRLAGCPERMVAPVQRAANVAMQAFIITREIKPHIPSPQRFDFCDRSLQLITLCAVEDATMIAFGVSGLDDHQNEKICCVTAWVAKAIAIMNKLEKEMGGGEL